MSGLHEIEQQLFANMAKEEDRKRTAQSIESLVDDKVRKAIRPLIERIAALEAKAKEKD